MRMRRRWETFCKNRRGFYSLILLLLVICVSMAADLVANDKPMLVFYENEFYFPMFESIPETTFGGFFETETDYNDKYVVSLIEDKGGWLVRALIPYGVMTRTSSSAGPSLQPPSASHWLGTDDQGRDVLSRLIHGLRISLIFGIIYTVGASFIGIIVGLLQGYYGGYGDLIGQRFIEIWSGVPVFFLLIILSSMVEPSLLLLVGLVVLFGWTSLVGLVRAESLRTRNLPYVRAARALGVGDMGIIFKHVLPNAMVSSLTILPFMPATSIGLLASLDFLGFGLPLGTASLGELLKQGKENPQAPWLGLVGFFSMTILFCLMVFIGEAVRDTFNPRKSW